MEIQPIISINSMRKTVKIKPDDKKQSNNETVAKKKPRNNTSQHNDEDTDAEHIDEFV